MTITSIPNTRRAENAKAISKNLPKLSNSNKLAKKVILPIQVESRPTKCPVDLFLSVEFVITKLNFRCYYTCNNFLGLILLFPKFVLYKFLIFISCPNHQINLCLVQLVVSNQASLLRKFWSVLPFQSNEQLTQSIFLDHPKFFLPIF